MSDCILFSILFATYAVLVNGTQAAPTGKDIFELPFVLVKLLAVVQLHHLRHGGYRHVQKTTKARLSPGWH